MPDLPGASPAAPEALGGSAEISAALSKQLTEALVHRHAIAVGEAVGLVGHADDRDEFAQHLLRHAEPLCRGAMRMGAVLTGIGDADREVDQFLGERVERARRHHLFQALPGAFERRRVVGERPPEIVDPVGVAALFDVVEDGAHIGARRLLLDQRNNRHAYLPIIAGFPIPWRRSSAASRPLRNSASMRMSLASDHSGWAKVAGRLCSNTRWPSQAGP